MNLAPITFNQPTTVGGELDYLSDVLRSTSWSGNGTFCVRAERELRKIHQKPTLCVTSCTHALELCRLLLDLIPGDEVVVPSYTFVSSALAFLGTGVTPVFVDVEDGGLSMSAREFEKAITEKTRAVVVVHYAGIPADIETICEIAKSKGIRVIEDNAHGFLGSFRGTPLGTFGDLSTLSFHETKNLTCGEGGAIVIGDASLEERAHILRDKGTNRRAFLEGQVDKYTWVDFGSSYVLAEPLAAILCGQLESRTSVQEKRLEIWRFYESELSSWANRYGVRMLEVREHSAHAAHLFALRFASVEVRNAFIEHMRNLQISTVFHYQALHRSPMGKKFGRCLGGAPNSLKASDGLVRLPLHLGLSEPDLARIREAVTSFRPI